ncbi:MAG: CARDB domain-containing protein [Candidatus Eisenbacteria bacterium]
MSAPRAALSLVRLMPVLALVGVSAGPASALPDLRAGTPSGWSGPLVLRGTADATPFSALDSPVLAGAVNCFISSAVQNAGTTATTVDASVDLRVDGVGQIFSTTDLVPPGFFSVATNDVLNIPGGLHTIGEAMDVTNLVAESDETNNEFARQISFTPLDIPVEGLTTRAAPPDRFGGTAGVVGPAFLNQDAVRTPPAAQPWRTIALRPPVGEDYDLALYDASTGITNGFRTPLKQSTFGTGATDFIINNVSVGGAYDAGVINFSGTLGNYSIEHRGSAGIVNTGQTLAGATLAVSQMFKLYEYTYVPDVNVPRVLIEVTGTPGQVLHVAYYNQSTTIASRSEALADAQSDASGRAYLDFPVATTGGVRHDAIVVYRDQTDGGTDATTFTLSIRQTPADLSNAQLPGLTEPVNASTGAASWTVNPTTLNGNASGSTMAFYYKNVGTQSSGTFQLDTRLDGVSLLQFGASSLAPGIGSQQAVGPLTVRGGRHTLSYLADATNTVDEVLETNNAYGRQFVWTPLQLAGDTPLTRAMPPDPQGGWSEIPNSVTKYNNCDGLRSPAFPDGFLHSVATAVTPGAGSDVDLDLFALSTGALDGFATPRATSALGVGLTDLVYAADHNGQPVYDIGVRRFSGANVPYTIETVFSTEIGFATGLPTGHSTILAGHIVKAFRIAVLGPSLPFAVALDNLSGGADLALGVFAADVAPNEVGSIGTALPGGLADANGPGKSEVALVTAPAPFSSYAIIVWKHGSADLSKPAEFELRINPPNLDVAPTTPHVVSFALAGGNPLRSSTRMQFDLPQAATVALDVLDLQGRRVRTLAVGTHSAGSHTLAWDGRDEQGSAVANGAYFVRFTSGAFQRVSKLAVLR